LRSKAQPFFRTERPATPASRLVDAIDESGACARRKDEPRRQAQTLKGDGFLENAERISGYLSQQAAIDRAERGAKTPASVKRHVQKKASSPGAWRKRQGSSVESRAHQ
jgi:hypothetical protein